MKSVGLWVLSCLGCASLEHFKPFLPFYNYIFTIKSASKSLGSGLHARPNDRASLNLAHSCCTSTFLCSTFSLLAAPSCNYFHQTCEWLSPSLVINYQGMTDSMGSNLRLGYIQACLQPTGWTQASLSFQITGFLAATGQSLPTKCFRGFFWTMAGWSTWKLADPVSVQGIFCHSQDGTGDVVFRRLYPLVLTLALTSSDQMWKKRYWALLNIWVAYWPKGSVSLFLLQ